MLNMDQKLIKRQEEGKIIKTGIVGAGQMGRGMVTQMVLMNGITPAIVSDIKVENAVHAFKYAGVSDEDISKMAAVNSNTQLYKQFGNSIVVDVMCEMFKNLNIEQGSKIRN